MIRKEVSRVETLVRQLQGEAADLQVIAGLVDDTGSVDYGAGFSSTRTATGMYTVTFDEGYEELPVVVAGVFGGTGAAVRCTTITTADFDVETFIFSGGVASNVDSAFAFIARQAS